MIDTPLADSLAILAQQIIDWDYLATFSGRHGVWPLLLHNLNQIVPDIVPTTAVQPIKQRYLLQHECLLAGICSLTSVFAVHGIRVISYKGPTLSAIAYNDHSLRLSRDLDLLIHPRDYTKAKALVLNCGYIPVMDCGYKYHFRDGTEQLNVDLHRGLVPRWYKFAFSFDNAWERCTPFIIESYSDVPTFCLEDLLVVLCLDLVKDLAQCSNLRLVKVTDIAELLCGGRISWVTLVPRIKYMGISRAIYLALLIADRLYDIEVPPEVRRDLESQIGLAPLVNLTVHLIFPINEKNTVASPRIFHEVRTVAALHDSNFRKLMIFSIYLLRPLRSKHLVAIARHVISTVVWFIRKK